MKLRKVYAKMCEICTEVCRFPNSTVPDTHIHPGLILLVSCHEVLADAPYFLGTCFTQEWV
jgi:hypothetical protein